MDTKIINVLVTGVGSELAFGIIKALKLSSLNIKIYGVDVYPEVVGKNWCDEFYQVSYASDIVGYEKDLRKIINDKNIEILIPSVDQEFVFLAKIKHSLFIDYNCHVLINEIDEINLFNDKWFAHLWFKKNQIGSPETFLTESFNDNSINGDEFIIKPRTGGGSRNIFKFSSLKELNSLKEVVPNPIIQTILLPDNEEYTATVFQTKKNELNSILFRRTLKFGMTNTAEVVDDKNLKNFVEDIVRKSNLLGSNNIQFRNTQDGPKLLEINPRFSGTVGIRANFGFNDVEYWIKDVLNLPQDFPKINIKKGFVLRFMEEQYHFI